jgi:hypothetical protein
MNSGGPVGMVESLGGLVEALKRQSVGRNSQDKNNRHWIHWKHWCGLMEMPALLPRARPTENALQFSYFAVYLFLHGWNTKERKKQHGIIASKVSAVRWYHRVLTGHEPEMDMGFLLVMRKLKWLSRPVAKKHLMTPDMLRSIYRRLDLSQSGHILLWGLFLIGYFVLLRRGEFLKVDGKSESYVLHHGYIPFYDRNEVVCKSKNAAMVGLTLRGGKNNQYVRNEIRYQNATSDPLLCPVRGLAWIRMAGRVHKTKPWEHVSKISKDHGVGNGHIIQVLKQISKGMGLDERNYSTHLIRIGGSTALLNAGARPLVIKLLGRWLSDC